ncbi:hypothetical protein EA462_16880 [Natrarchaeobius halalkaliphilus]|uniref:Uncharacterized protein n=1 Tax=Natrarchaeobius halalkaliphilus TaxID=1679091 RepID=A0A3N6NTY5_9EURY|nr:hypothetical protein [Natrarchaeobius halalkaliphilus]RQG86146.1 hypothetical protein EA462_16880 [Natrarchaeobius halalkaliphilus]
MTSTATNSSENTGLLKTRFSIGAAGLAAISVLVALLFAWTGYRGDELLIVGTEMDVVTGMAGAMMALFIAVVALIAAAYMEPGFDH